MRVASEKAQLSDMSRIESVSKNLPANCYKNFTYSHENEVLCKLQQN